MTQCGNRIANGQGRFAMMEIIVGNHKKSQGFYKMKNSFRPCKAPGDGFMESNDQQEDKTCYIKRKDNCFRPFPFFRNREQV